MMKIIIIIKKIKFSNFGYNKNLFKEKFLKKNLKSKMNNLKI